MIFGTRKKVGKGKEGGAPCSAVFSPVLLLSATRRELQDRFTNSRRCVAFFRPGFHARTRFHSCEPSCVRRIRRSLENFYKIPSSTNFHFYEKKENIRGAFFSSCENCSKRNYCRIFEDNRNLLLGHPVCIWRRIGKRKAMVRERESQVRVRNWSIIEVLSRLGNRATISQDQEAWKSVEIGIGIGRTGGHRFPSPEKHGWKSRYYSDTEGNVYPLEKVASNARPLTLIAG